MRINSKVFPYVEGVAGANRWLIAPIDPLISKKHRPSAGPLRARWDIHSSLCDRILRPSLLAVLRPCLLSNRSLVLEGKGF